MIPSYLYISSFPTGSSYICNPPVTDTDIDEMFLVDDLHQVTNKLIDSFGWTYSPAQDNYGGSDWTALRKGNLNALITNNSKYFLDFYKATELAKQKNLLNKEDRIALFQEITGRKPKPKPDISEYNKAYSFWTNAPAATPIFDELMEAVNTTVIFGR